MSNIKNHRMPVRTAFRGALCGVLLVLGASGCVMNADEQSSAEVDRPLTAPVTPAVAPSISQTVGATCTDAWRRHGHTNQREAKAFLTQCLADQGVVGRRMNRETVFATAVASIPENGPLNRLAPADIAVFCPGYATMDSEQRAIFWRTFVTALARPESDFNTTASLWEGGSLNQFSIGLLQLSFTDRAYGCDFQNETDIADPARNLSCGVKIIDRLVSRDGVIGGGSAGNRGAARYWSTIRSTSPARAEIIRATSSIPSCMGG